MGFQFGIALSGRVDRSFRLTGLEIAKYCLGFEAREERVSVFSSVSGYDAIGKPEMRSHFDPPGVEFEPIVNSKGKMNAVCRNILTFEADDGVFAGFHPDSADEEGAYLVAAGSLNRRDLIDAAGLVQAWLEVRMIELIMVRSESTPVEEGAVREPGWMELPQKIPRSFTSCPSVCS